MGNDVEPLATAVRERARVVDAGSWVVERDGVVIDASYRTSDRYPQLEISFPFERAQPIAMIEASESGYREGGAPTRLRAIRPLAITLRRETDADRKSKAAGVNRELQTGDASFDESIYVDTPTADAVLARLLASPEVRGAIKELVTLDCELSIDGDNARVMAVWSQLPPPLREASSSGLDAYADRAIAAMLTLARMLPVVAASGKPRTDAVSSWTTGGFVAVVIGAIGVYSSLFALAPAECLERHGSKHGLRFTMPCAGPSFLGALIGIVVGVFVFRAVERALRPRLGGRSDSSSRITKIGLVAFLATVEVAVLVAELVGELVNSVN